MQTFGGAALCTFKLHLAVCHLADQVRSCGPAFFSLEFWIERMIQLLKRLTKYRATCDPEAIFVNDQLLRRTCMLLVHDPKTSGLVCESLDEALLRVRAERSRQRRGVRDEELTQPDDRVFGRGKELTPRERAEVLPVDYTGEGEPSGLPYLLLQEASLELKGWPAWVRLDGTGGRGAAIHRSLGLPIHGAVDEEAQEGTVLVRKFMRAAAAVGDVMSCAQQTTQGVKDNKWCLMAYTIATTQPDGNVVETVDYYVGELQYLLRATLRPVDGLYTAASQRRRLQPLYLGVADLYRCDMPDTPGARQPDAVSRRPPEFFRVTRARRGVGPYAGRWVLDLDSVPCQLVPTVELGGVRYFQTANKASGRTVRV